MASSKRTLFRWIVWAGSLLAGLEILSIITPWGGLAPYLHYLAYMSLANSFVPLPTNPLTIFMGREFGPPLVALVGAAGTSVANTTEYLLLGTLFERYHLRKLKETGLYRAVRRYFGTAPFLLMVSANFLPLPIDPIRWTAISVGYPRWKYVSATFLGRLPRYYLLAWLGDRYRLSNRWILVTLAASAMPFLVRRALTWLRKGG